MLDQSKTRSFQIVSQNPQGSQLCLQNLFVNVYQQLVHFFVLEISTRRVVYFLDEGSLRDEKKMVLKVLHSYLDEYKVVFVAVVNKPFDVANVNRMICIYRSLLSKDNKKILKYACLGLQIDHEHQTTENDFNNIIFELCQDYRRILTNSNILHILHNRDFRYMLRELHFELPKTREDQETSIIAIQPISLLRTLVNNFNGIKQNEFRESFNTFF